MNVAHASLRAGEAASLPPLHRKRETNPGRVPTPCRRSWKFILSLSKGFVTGPHLCGPVRRLPCRPCTLNVKQTQAIAA